MMTDFRCFTYGPLRFLRYGKYRPGKHMQEHGKLTGNNVNSLTPN